MHVVIILSIKHSDYTAQPQYLTRIACYCGICSST